MEKNLLNAPLIKFINKSHFMEHFKSETVEDLKIFIFGPSKNGEYELNHLANIFHKNLENHLSRYSSTHKG
jgi:hypothetical protein